MFIITNIHNYILFLNFHINKNYSIHFTSYINFNFFFFLEKLSNLITDQELDFRRLNNGIRSRRNRSRANRERDTKIINAQQDLVNKRYNFVIYI